jgi:hypothetical protein
MLFTGGTIDSNNIYKHIKSIGYEFETHDLSKLINVDDNILINSDIVPQTLNNMIEDDDAIKLDDNYYKIIESNRTYNELIDMPITTQGKLNSKYNVMMNIATDIGKTDFFDTLIPICHKLKKSKNDLYTFKTIKTTDKKSKEYKIYFSEQLQKTSCGTFAGVEYIITYYNPEKSNNIILDTFTNACYHIYNHLQELIPIPGVLMINANTKHKTKIGKPNRLLFHHNNSNLYYLQTNKFKSINEIEIIPQMTFRVDTKFAIQVMKEIVYNKTHNTKATKDLSIDYKNIQHVENCVDELLNAYSDKIIKIKHNQIIKVYLFMIFYKIYMYIKYWISYDKKFKSKKTTVKYYFKDFLTFASRHSNLNYYNGIKQIIMNKSKKLSKSDAFFIIIDLIFKPDILKKYLNISIKSIKSNDFDNKSPNYGNPNKEFLSYFYKLDSGKDWFVTTDIDTYSTEFDLPTDNTILIEDRGFYVELQVFTRDETGVLLNKHPYIKNFVNIGKQLIVDNRVKDLNNKIWNPKTKRYNKIKKTSKNLTKKNKHIKFNSY